MIYREQTEWVIRDRLPTIAISSERSGEEGFPPYSSDFSLTLSSPQSFPVYVEATTRLGTAIGGADYIHQHSILTIPAGQVKATFSVPIIDDDEVESSEVFYANLIASDEAAIFSPSAAGYIRDNDGPSALRIHSLSFSGGRVRFKFNTVLGSYYLVESSTSIDSGPWSRVTQEREARQLLTEFVESAPSQDALPRYFRVRRTR
ncbi:MAG: hypothetical protein FJ405_15575 [Verrucomicrobia bacterium]|nr:hypothetical protein [Verrucomicrobiota bacterium]